MQLSELELDDLYDNGHMNKTNFSGRLYNINKCMQWALEYDKPTSALFELRDLAVILKNSLLK